MRSSTGIHAEGGYRLTAGAVATLLEWRAPDGCPRPVTLALWPEYSGARQADAPTESVLDTVLWDVDVDGRSTPVGSGVSVSQPYNYRLGARGHRRSLVASAVRVRVQALSTLPGTLTVRGALVAGLDPPHDTISVRLRGANNETPIPQFAVELRCLDWGFNNLVLSTLDPSGTPHGWNDELCQLFRMWTPLPPNAALLTVSAPADEVGALIDLAVEFRR